MRGMNLETIIQSEVSQKEKILRRGGKEYTELYKKDLHDTDNHNVLITYIQLEPDILECKAKWGLRKHHYEQS